MTPKNVGTPTACKWRLSAKTSRHRVLTCSAKNVEGQRTRLPSMRDHISILFCPRIQETASLLAGKHNEIILLLRLQRALQRSICGKCRFAGLQRSRISFRLKPACNYKMDADFPTQLLCATVSTILNLCSSII